MFLVGIGDVGIQGGPESSLLRSAGPEVDDTIGFLEGFMRSTWQGPGSRSEGSSDSCRRPRPGKTYSREAYLNS